MGESRGALFFIVWDVFVVVKRVFPIQWASEMSTSIDWGLHPSRERR
tara:strand:- start:190 stop:330 length:141 start_codon:yes stop_codon:yes gene_type:complete